MPGSDSAVRAEESMREQLKTGVKRIQQMFAEYRRRNAQYVFEPVDDLGELEPREPRRINIGRGDDE